MNREPKARDLIERYGFFISAIAAAAAATAAAAAATAAADSRVLVSSLHHLEIGNMIAIMVQYPNSQPRP